MDKLANIMREMGQNARAASGQLRLAPAQQRASAIREAATAIEQASQTVLEANQKDMQRGTAKGISPAFLDRMRLDAGRVKAIADALRTIADQPDPLGVELQSWQQPNGLRFRKVAVPIGVIGIVYESRPNVTADAAALCLRSGNTAILRGGSDALQTSLAIFNAFQTGIIAAGLPEHCVQLVTVADRAAVGHLLAGLDNCLDLMIPRGGKSLVDRVQREARIPVLSHLEGICHVYVHHAANPQMAREIVLNAKMRRVGICGAAECLLIDRACAAALLPQIADDLHAAGCEMRGDEAAQALDARIVAATDSDWGHEFLAPILAIRVVDDLQMAMDHIAHYGSAHTDCIITDDRAVAKTFQQSVDSAIVLHNASTQFADGGEFGFGAEIGIATGKLHARGPVGATQLTSYAYYVDGDGQVRPD